ncbi:hypothetical protein EDB19DRAFT_95672 [Suillus lakei]|nr:hypothetical protein EDB19DRAFT_95672 [Suillus lakei]
MRLGLPARHGAVNTATWFIPGFLVWITFLSTKEIPRDLLENRSQNCSDRREIATNELFGVDHTTAFMRYNSKWRLQRKILHQSFRQDVVPDFRPMQVAKTHELLLNLLEDPSGYPKHLEV